MPATLIPVNKPVSEVFDEALALSEKDRAALAKRLIESLDGPPDTDAEQAWAKEIEGRVEDIVAGKAKTMTWDEVHARSLAKRRDGR